MLKDINFHVLISQTIPGVLQFSIYKPFAHFSFFILLIYIPILIYYPFLPKYILYE